MIKYLGSKRRIAPALGVMAKSLAATTALDLFAGTTRVAQAFKHGGAFVTACDLARYSEVFAQCYIAADASSIDSADLATAVADLQCHADDHPVDGYVTETFCRRARFFQPHNGRRIDAARAYIAERWTAHPYEPILLTSLIEAADRVDSTVGVQMAYLKEWSRRSFNSLDLRVPELLDGPGRAERGDSVALVDGLGSFDLAYFDPPYNQHRYFTNYHIWETLVADDEPEYYGVACKRLDARDAATASIFNRKRAFMSALTHVMERVDADVVILSYNDESWVSLEQLTALGAERGTVAVLGFDAPRYVGARIGIHNPQGERVGTPGRLRNLELLVICGPSEAVGRLVDVGMAHSAELVVRPQRGVCADR